MLSCKRVPFISQIYWPEFLLSIKKNSYLVGWNLENFQCCVTNVFAQSEITLEDLTNILKSVDTISSISECSKTGSAPIVLGEWIPTLKSTYIPESNFQESGIWITLTKRHQPGPVLHSLYSCGCLHKTSCHMIQYLPNVIYNLNSNSGYLDNTHCNVDTNTSDIAYTICQINSAKAVHYFVADASLKFQQRHIHINCTTAAATATVSGLGLGLASTGKANRTKDGYSTNINNGSSSGSNNSIFESSPTLARSGGHRHRLVRPGHVHISLLLLYLTKQWSIMCNAMKISFSTQFLSCTNHVNVFYILRLLREKWKYELKLESVSITAANLCDKFNAFADSLHKVIAYQQHSAKPSLQQILLLELLSSLVLMWIDLLWGMTVGYIFFYNKDVILSQLHEIAHRVQHHVLIDSLQLFNDSPIGIKLNQALTWRISNLLIDILREFNSLYHCINPVFEETCIYLVVCSSSMGFTTQLSLLIDIIRFLTLHIAVVHSLLSIIHSTQVSVLRSLFYLFQGKKNNVLRGRVDTLVCDNKVLFVGVVLFSMLFFLFPTFLLFYILFTCLRVAVVLSQALLWCAIVIFKEFPYFTCFIRLLHHFSYTHMSQHLHPIYLLFKSVHVEVVTPSSRNDKAGTSIIRGRITRVEKNVSSKVIKLNKNGTQTISFVVSTSSLAGIDKADIPSFGGVVGHHKQSEASRREFPHRFSSNGLSRRDRLKRYNACDKSSAASVLRGSPVTDTHLTSKWGSAFPRESDGDIVTSANEEELGNTLHSLDVDDKSSYSIHEKGESSSREAKIAADKSPPITATTIFGKRYQSVEMSSTDSDTDNYGLGWARSKAGECEEDTTSASDTNKASLDGPVRPGGVCDSTEVVEEEESNILNGSEYCSSRNKALRSRRSRYIGNTFGSSHGSVERNSVKRSVSSGPEDNSATYLAMLPCKFVLSQEILNSYVPYLVYWSMKRPAQHLLLGVFYGSPPLDLQIIQASIEIFSWKNNRVPSYRRRASSSDPAGYVRGAADSVVASDENIPLLAGDTSYQSAAILWSQFEDVIKTILAPMISEQADDMHSTFNSSGINSSAYHIDLVIIFLLFTHATSLIAFLSGVFVFLLLIYKSVL